MITPGRSWRLSRLLGQGAFGAVYLAEQVNGDLHRRVAIKMLHPDRAATPAIVRRLRDEARLLSLLRHRAIVRVDDLVELDGAWSIVMEYVDGADVASLLSAGPLPPRPALQVAAELASALWAAWNQPGPQGRPLNLVHRDIKPSNVRLTDLGEVKLLDFGVARADFTGREAASTQHAMGTLIYMAAERFNGDDSPAGDVYALGVMLFEMLTGVPPGSSALDPDRQPPGKVHAASWSWLQGLHPGLQPLLAKMLSPDPSERPDARSVARELSEMAARIGGENLEDWASRTVPAWISANPAPVHQGALTQRSGATLVEGGRPKEGSRWTLLAGLFSGALLVGGVALLLLGGVVGGWLYFRDPPAEGTGSGTGSEMIPENSQAEGQGAGGSSTGEPGTAASGTSGGASAGNATPGTATPGTASPGNATPGTATPGTASPGTASPGTASSGTASSGTASSSGKDTSRTGASAGTSSTAGSSPGTSSAGSAAAGTSSTAPASGGATGAAAGETTAPASAGATTGATTALSTTGRWRIQGDGVSAVLTGGGKTWRTGEVPPGLYTAKVTFPDAEITVSSVIVTAGSETVVACNPKFKTCRVQ